MVFKFFSLRPGRTVHSIYGIFPPPNRGQNPGQKSGLKEVKVNRNMQSTHPPVITALFVSCQLSLSLPLSVSWYSSFSFTLYMFQSSWFLQCFIRFPSSFMSFPILFLFFVDFPDVFLGSPQLGFTVRSPSKGQVPPVGPRCGSVTIREGAWA